MANPTKTAPKKPAAKSAAPQAAAAAKKVVKQAVAPVAAAAPPAATKSTETKSKKTAVAAQPGVTPEQRLNYVEVAAYYIAEREGFVPGRELENWAAAEAEIDRLLASGLFNHS